MRFPASRPPYPLVTEAGLAGFVLTALALTGLRDLDPVRTYLSEYAVGPGGWAMRAAFGMLGAASLNLVPGFLDAERAPDGGRSIGRLLAVWAGAVVVAGLFPVDPRGAPATPAGAVHLIASLVAFGALFGAMAVAARRFDASAAWRPLARPTRWVAVATPAAFVAEVSLFTTIGWVGVGQWIVFGLATGWLAALARRFRRPARSGPAPRSATPRRRPPTRP